MQRTVADLAKFLEQASIAMEKRPALLLGAGSSVAAGVSPMRELMLSAFGCTDFTAFSRKIEEMNDRERFSGLFRHLQNDDPFAVTDGYRALARLVGRCFFDVILTTNLDPLLEDALVADGLRRRDYVLVVNAFVNPARIGQLLGGEVPRVKVLKLHGDLFHRVMAWTPEEMVQFDAEIADNVTEAMYGRDLIVVGHSLADSAGMRLMAENVMQKGHAVWFVNPGALPDWLKGGNYARNVRHIGGEEGMFEIFFPELAKALKCAPNRGSDHGARHDALTLDDAVASVVGIARPGDAPKFTGFALGTRRCVVSDALAAASAGISGTAKIVTGDGHAVEMRVRRRIDEFLFGPIVFDIPEGFRLPTLEVERGPLTGDLAVSVLVKGGERPGISSGIVADVSEQSLPTAQLITSYDNGWPQEHAPLLPATVSNLVELRCAVAKGSCGAPVLDENMKVRGFIVAGRDDLARPQSFMYQAQRWVGAL
jgi:hypothetical protein